MADTKITALTALTAADPANDVLPIVDVSDTTMAASGTTKKISVNNILGASGTATLASATITGDLTVDTSTLKVDSANNRVGVNTATPSYDLDVNGVANFKDAVVHRIGGQPMFARVGAANSFLYSGTTALTVRNNADTSDLMTLNSTGLGVGGSPTSKLSIFAGADGDVGFFRGGSTRQLQIGTSATAGYLNADNGSAGFELRVNGTARAYFDTSGSVGIGVTPSAWAAGYRAIQISSNQSTALMGSGNQTELTTNAFFDGAWKYQGAGTVAASRYSQQSGVHYWYTAAAGAAGTAIGSGFSTAAMTLDASGNLLVGKSSASATTIGFEGRANGTVNSTLASSVDANATYAAYSTGAAAYRFYVGMGGTVYATNTTISAISDARLKENVQDIDVGLGAILALKPRKFDWKEGKGKNIKGDRGFIAQEFEQVFPQLVDEWKDEAPEGEAPYKSVRQDLIPVLVKAIQELTARVQTLETR